MSETVCPVCGAGLLENRHWVHCGKRNDASVCMRHCYRDGCKYLRNEWCTYNDEAVRRQDRRRIETIGKRKEAAV